MRAYNPFTKQFKTFSSGFTKSFHLDYVEVFSFLGRHYYIHHTQEGSVIIAEMAGISKVEEIVKSYLGIEESEEHKFDVQRMKESFKKGVDKL